MGVKHPQTECVACERENTKLSYKYQFRKDAPIFVVRKSYQVDDGPTQLEPYQMCCNARQKAVVTATDFNDSVSNKICI